MPMTDPRIDAYIAKSADFARPILEHLRSTVHEACPDVEETVKWSAPCFVHAGGILCSMVAFKQHASFGFWKHALVMGEDASPEGMPREGMPREDMPREGMGSFGKLKTISDLPSKKQLLAWIGKAATLNEMGVKTAGVRKAGKPKLPPVAPPDLTAALKKNRKAQAAYDAFPRSHRCEYIEWITAAKREQTRQPSRARRRLSTATRACGGCSRAGCRRPRPVWRRHPDA